ncbi:MAG: chemotaxis protein CheW [Betaproteobacteria bacterium]|nr:chemotaxis protein CheW [Betaproteobacteria bacterium]
MNEATQISAGAAKPEIATSPDRQEFLTFTLGKEEYGVEILKVQEIRSYEQVTTIANAPEFIKGVVNLRGIIVPIVDMRIKFNLGKAEYDQFTVVIILNVAGRVVGMVVDGVSDVIALGPEQVRPAPDFSSSFDIKYITGLGTVDERMLILVDIEKLMGSADMALMEQTTLQ